MMAVVRRCRLAVHHPHTPLRIQSLALWAFEDG